MTRRVLRRSQAVVPFGVGAMLDLPGESLMAAGLDAWGFSSSEEKIYDERLARRLGVSFFRQPPAEERPDGQPGSPLPFVRFPRWHFCPRCRMLQKVPATDFSTPRCVSEVAKPGAKACAKLPPKQRRKVIPLRFVAACSDGHIEDFPWVEWVHTPTGSEVRRGEGACEKPLLRFPEPFRAGLPGLFVYCQTCDAKRSLLGAASPDGIKGFQCRGERPWLGPDGRDPGGCDKTLRMLQRGATSSHFSRVASSILIPPFSSKLARIVDEEWQDLEDEGLVDDELHGRENLGAVVGMIARKRKVDRDQLLKAVLGRLDRERNPDRRQSEPAYRLDEYRALLSTSHDPEDFLVLQQLSVDDYSPSVTQYFENIVQIEKLAETRALIGFSRIEPSSAGPSEVDWNMLSLSRKPWLPAFRVLGEGLFLTLDRQRVQRWLQEPDPHLSDLDKRQHEIRRRRGGESHDISPAFVLLHTLAHLLIRQLSFECGYGSSSLRERIYCSSPGEPADRWMCGLLIYTAAGDAEGTMGGLVSQGNPGRLEAILENALLDASWCASDPLCRESPGQGADSLNLAACHACALLPETSCEEGNRLLDRLTLIGSPQDGGDRRRQTGYFAELLHSLLQR